MFTRYCAIISARVDVGVWLWPGVMSCEELVAVYVGAAEFVLLGVPGERVVQDGVVVHLRQVVPGRDVRPQSSATASIVMFWDIGLGANSRQFCRTRRVDPFVHGDREVSRSELSGVLNNAVKPMWTAATATTRSMDVPRMTRDHHGRRGGGRGVGSTGARRERRGRRARRPGPRPDWARRSARGWLGHGAKSSGSDSFVIAALWLDSQPGSPAAATVSGRTR